MLSDFLFLLSIIYIIFLGFLGFFLVYYKMLGFISRNMDKLSIMRDVLLFDFFILMMNTFVGVVTINVVCILFA